MPAQLFNYDEVCDDLTVLLFFMLTSLEPPSPTSSSGPHEVQRPPQTAPQLPGTPGSYPEKHRDTSESSRITPVFKRWFQTRFKRSNRNQASRPPDQLSTKSGRPLNPSFPVTADSEYCTKRTIEDGCRETCASECFLLW